MASTAKAIRLSTLRFVAINVASLTTRTQIYVSDYLLATMRGLIDPGRDGVPVSFQSVVALLTCEFMTLATLCVPKSRPWLWPAELLFLSSCGARLLDRA